MDVMQFVKVHNEIIYDYIWYRYLTNEKNIKETLDFVYEHEADELGKFLLQYKGSYESFLLGIGEMEYKIQRKRKKLLTKGVMINDMKMLETVSWSRKLAIWKVEVTLEKKKPMIVFVKEKDFDIWVEEGETPLTTFEKEAIGYYFFEHHAQKLTSSLKKYYTVRSQEQ